MSGSNYLRTYLSKFYENNALPLLTAAFVGAILLLSPSNQLNDGDTLWHITLGQRILETWKLPEHDNFSYLFEGETYRTTSWLSDVLLGAAFNLGGFFGVVALSTFCVALTFYLLQKEYLKRLSDKMAIYFCCATFVLLAPHILSRPHVLIYPLIALWAIWMIESEKNNEVPPIKTLPVFFLWANMHGSFILGFVIAAPLCLIGLFSNGEFHREKLRPWIVFLASMVVVTLLGPYGYHLLTGSLKFFELGDILNYVVEWKPQDFTSLGVFECILLLTIGVIAFGGVRLAPARIVILLGLLHMALSHVRSTDYLAIIGSLLLLEPVAQALPGKKHSINAKRIMPVGLTVIVVEILVILGLRPVLPPEKIYPLNAIDVVKKRGQKDRIFNDYNFGGALIFVGMRVFIDSRQEFYPKEFQMSYYNICDKKNFTELGDYLDKYGITLSLLKSDRSLATEIAKLPNWQEIHRDDIAVVHVRADKSSPRQE